MGEALGLLAMVALVLGPTDVASGAPAGPASGSPTLTVPPADGYDLAGRPIPDESMSDRLMPPVERPYFKLPERPLEPVSTNGTSLGTAESGYLIGGVRLPMRGRHYQVLGAHRDRKDLHWGTRELVDLVRYAAGYVAARHPGSVLAVGNMSRRRGGDIPYSVSHNSGRDVDLAYFIQTRAGRYHVPWNYFRLGPDGRPRSKGHRGLRLDVARTWTLVEALLTHPTVQVQWIFMEHHLERLVLEHARGLPDVDPDVVERAERVVSETPISPHDDHIHVRIYCPPDDLLDGCRDDGPIWPWVERFQDALSKRIDQLMEVFEQDPGHRGAVLRRLVFIAAVEAGPRLADAMAGLDRDTRLEVASTLRRLPWARTAKAIEEAISRERDPEVRAELILALGAMGDESAWETIAGHLGPGPARVRVAAARALGELRAPEGAGPLVACLEDASPELRRVAAGALHLITNRAEHPAGWWAGQRSGAELAKSRMAWESWLRGHGHMARERWLLEGFLGVGYRGASLPFDFGQVRWLIRAREDRRPYVAANAEDLLRAIAGMEPRHSGEAMHRPDFWKIWWIRMVRLKRRMAG